MPSSESNLEALESAIGTLEGGDEESVLGEETDDMPEGGSNIE